MSCRGDALRLGSKGRHGSRQVKLSEPFANTGANERFRDVFNVHNKALHKSTLYLQTIYILGTQVHLQNF